MSVVRSLNERCLSINTPRSLTTSIGVRSLTRKTREGTGVLLSCKGRGGAKYTELRFIWIYQQMVRLRVPDDVEEPGGRNQYLR